MDQQYGAEDAALLKCRIADLRAAVSLGDVPILELIPVPASQGSEVAFAVGRLTVVLKANQRRPSKLADGEIDWPNVERVLIQRIERAHG